MSLIKTGQGVTDIRGGFGGVYFTRDKSGLHSSAKPRRVHQITDAQRKQRNAFIAARALSKDNRTVSYLMYRYMNGLPLQPHCDVTGNPVPDCTGKYEFGGTHEGKNYYKRPDSAFFIFYYPTDDLWYITDLLGSITEFAWYRVKTIEGIYIPYPEFEGNPVVDETLIQVPPDYQIPKL